MCRRFAVGLVVLAFLLVAMQCLRNVQALGPPAKILALEYPHAVRTASQLNVTVEVAYSSKFGMIDVGIWDIGTGTVIQSLVSNVTLFGPGQASFSFSLQSPSKSGQWNLEVITRAWVQDAWFTDDAGFYPFSVLVVNKVGLTLDNLQPGSTFLLDGKNFTSTGKPVDVPLTFGVHSLQIPGIISTGSGSRLVFVGWSDGSSSNPRTLIVAENLSLSPIYMKQYWLAVTSDVGSATGSGWYREGENAGVAVIPEITEPILFGLLTTTYSFDSWSGAIDSTSVTSAVLMDSPKTVNVRWIQTGFNLNLSAVGDLLVLASCFLAIRVGRIVLRGKTARPRINAVAFCLLILVPFILMPPQVLAQVPTPTNAAVVRIGDASWYYWDQTASDTCILWLGGGTIYSQGGYLINPLDYESFGTIRFLQELTKYYCLIALENGPFTSTDTTNRTIHQEWLQGQYSIIRQVHEWISTQGYKHTFLIGYSVGAMAAATIAVSDPETWTSSDGLILITAFLPPNAISGAEGLRANLMLIYGHAPMYEETGHQFFNRAPSEGWHGQSYFHKEFHVLDDMGHEVWSPLQTNRYSPLALGMTINFIQQSNALIFGENSSTGLVQGNGTVEISPTKPPTRVYSNSPFFLNVALTSKNFSSTETVVVAYAANTSSPVSSTQLSRDSTSTATVRLIIPPANASLLLYELLVLQKQNGQWKPASKPYPTSIEATNLVTLQIISIVPNNRIQIDGRTYTTSASGGLQLNMSRGTHMIAVQPIIYQTNETRYVFRQWDDSDPSTTKTMELNNDTVVEPLYTEQYYVSVVSQFGVTDGSGWHDANSTLMPNLNPLISNQPPAVFNYWTHGDSEFELGTPIQVSSPSTIKADWHSEATRTADGTTWVTFSAIIFLVMLALNLIMRKRSDRK